MSKRRFKVFIISIVLLYGYGIFGLYSAFNNEYLSTAVSNQSIGRMEIVSERGTVYDRNLVPLTNTSQNILAVAAPSPSAISEIEKHIEIDPEQVIKDAKPLYFYTDTMYKTDYIDFFNVDKRYSESGLASHLIGYTDYSGQGVSGVEKAFDDMLESNGKLILNYSVDALGRMIVGADRSYTNTLGNNEQGVILTIDSDIQKKLEEELEAIEKGAAVVMSVETSEILAVASTPSYNQNDLESALNAENSPMINRAFSAYAPGSVFKLVVATTALKDGDLDERAVYECDGSIEVGHLEISCYGNHAHGEVNMNTALSKSCNGYFIDLALKLDEEEILETAQDMGFSKETEFYNNFVSPEGNLPDKFYNDVGIANLAIGQGDVLVTPIQVATAISTIANGGVYQESKLYEGQYLLDGTILYNYETSENIRVMDKSTSSTLKNYMESAVKFGTGVGGKIDDYLVGAKTGTAQTGIFEDGNELVNYWYAGYIGNESASEYVIVVLSEGQGEGPNLTDEVFVEVGRYILEEKS